MKLLRSAVGLLLVLFAFGTPVRGQPVLAPTGGDEPAGRRVYVPVEDFDVVLEHDKQGVILSKEEFLKLAAEAKKNLDETPQSPHKIVVSGAQYTARMQDEQLVVTAVIQLNQLARGWQMVTLPYRGLAVEGALLDDKPARIGRGAADGRPLVILSRDAGKHALQLELSAPLTTVGSDKVAAFGLAPISSATLQMSLPAGKFLHVDEIPLERPAAADRPAAYTVALGGKAGVALRVTDQRTQQNAASLVFAGTRIGLHVAPEERTWRGVTALSVYGKPIDNLTFVVPKSLDVVSVESTGLERWEIGEGPGGNTTTLKLVYRQPFSDARTATITGVSGGVIGQPWSVPTLALPGATSHLVRVVVEHPGGLRLQQVEATAVRRVPSDDTAETDTPGMPDPAVKAGLGRQLNYAAWREDFALLFVTQPRARELQATVATRVDIGARELALHASIAVQSRFAPLFDFDLALPVDWTVTDVLVNNRPNPWQLVPVAAGLNQVRVLFAAPIPADGKVNLTLAARMIPPANWPIEDQPLSFKLPEVSLPQVGVTAGRYMVAAEDDLDLTPEEVTGLDPVRLSADEQQAAGAPRLVYEYQDTRFGGTLKVSRKPVRVAAQTLAFHRLDRETLNSHLEARLVIQGGGLQKLQIALPESVGTNLRFSLVDPPGADPAQRPRITEQTAAPAADGERIWTLPLDQRAFGLVWLMVDLTAARPADATSFDLPGMRILSADRQNGFVAVEGGPDQQLKITARDAGAQPLLEIDPADVPVASGYIPQERIVGAFRAVQPGYRVALQETRFDRQAVPTVVCDKARLTSALGAGGQQQHKAEFILRAVGVQSLLIKLPDDATPWASLIDGRPVEVRVEKGADGEAWLVPLPQSSDPAQPHAIQLFYGTEGTKLENSGTLREVPPQIAAVSGQGVEQPVEILDREWTLYHPDETEIISSSGQFEPVERPGRHSLLGQLHASLVLAAPRDLWQKALWTAIAGAVIGVFFFAWRRRGAAGAVVTLLVGLILAIGVLYFTFASQEQSSSEYVAESHKLYPRHAGGGPGPTSLPTGAAPSATPSMAVEALDSFIAGVPKDAPMSRDGQLDFDVALDKAMEKREERGAMGLTAEGAVRFKEADNSGAEPAKQKHMGGAIARPGSGFIAFEGAEVSDSSSPNQVSGAIEKLRKDKGLANTFGQPLPPFAAGQFAEPAPGAKAGGEVPPATPESRGPVLKGALLSLAIDLPVAPDSRPTLFRYRGDPAAGQAPQVEVGIGNRRAVSILSLAWQAGVLLLFWFARHWSVGVRAALGVLGVLVPLALVSLLPLELLPYLDGLFLGSLWGLLLWLVCALFTHRRNVARAFPADVLRNSSAPVLLCALAVACGFATRNARAQDSKPQANARAQEEAGALVRRGTPTIVVPYDPAQDALQAARVFLPWEEFLELWNAAYPDKAAQPPAPTDGLVAEALYAVQMAPPQPGKKPLAEVSGRFVLDNLRDDQISLPLPLGRVALTQAQLDGKSAALVIRDSDSGPELTAVVPSPGVHVLDVKFSLPVEQTGAAGKFTFPAKPVAAGSLRFTLPAKDLNLRVSGGAATYRRLREGEAPIAIVAVDQGGDVTLAWTPTLAREAAEGIVHIESATALWLGDAGLRLASTFKYTVRQGTLSEATFTLPEGLLVRQIAGLDLGGWEIAGAGATRTLKVFLRRPVSDLTTLQFDLFMAQPFAEQAQPIVVPAFVPQGATRETGTLGVFAERQLAVTVGAAAGLAQIDLAQFVAPAGLSPPGTSAPVQSVPSAAPLLAYRFAARPVNLQLLVARQKPQSKGTTEHAVVVGARKLRLASRLELHLAGAPQSEIAVQLPPGFLLYDLKSNDAADYHVEKRPGGQPGEQNALLVVEFPAPRVGTIELVLEGVVARSPADFGAKIAVPVPLGIGELRSALAVWLDGIYTGTLDDITGWRSLDPGELPERLRAAQGAPVQFAFTSNLTGVQPVTLVLHRATPRLSAEGLSVIIARDTSVQHLLYLRWNITAAGESTFVFTTPDWLADRLEFDRSTGGGRIRQVASDKIAGNRLRWTVTLDDPRTTVATLIAQAVLPPPGEGRVAAPAIVFERPTAGDNGGQYQALEQQHQYIVLVNESPQRLDREAGQAVEAIPAVDLPIRISKTISDRAAEILRVRDAQGAIAWQRQGEQEHQSLPASVNLARMTLVISRDGSWRGEARYRLNNRSRQFLALQMPYQSQILSLFVAGRPSRPIQPQNAEPRDLILVPLSKTAAGDLAIEVKLVYAGRFDRQLPRGVQVLRSEFNLPAPRVVGRNDPAAPAGQRDIGIPVAATEWTVVLPPDIDAARVDDSNRTNVAESEAGGEDLIARYNEWLNLFAIASDSSQSMRARSRAANNLKQMGLALHNYHDVETLIANDRQNLRQQGQLLDLRNKKEQAERQWEAQQATQENRPSRVVTLSDGTSSTIVVEGLSNTIVQRDLIADNTADFQPDKAAEESESLPQIALQQTQPSDTARADASQSQGKTGGKSSGINRRELRRETASQSQQLNEAVTAQPEPAQTAAKQPAAESSRKGRQPIRQDADADEVLSFMFSTDAAGAGGQSALGPGVHSVVPSQIGMGGMAGVGGGAGQVPAGAEVLAAGEIPGWTTAGGLSLDISVPQDGQKLTFSKSGGDARLALGLRPRASLESVFGLGWTIVWLLIALALIAALRRAHAWSAVAQRLPWIAAAVGLIWYFLLPAAPLGFALFVAGALCLGWQLRRA
jgi:hypothetical protein